jgi:1-acyl-sn-glycerol-3-phosphate acyltransferase
MRFHLGSCSIWGYTLTVDARPLQDSTQVTYPRRRLIRSVLRQLSRVPFAALCDLQIVGRENLPEAGPLIVVANHFHFADPVAIVRATHWPLDFLGGFNLVDAPPALTWIPRLWGYYEVRRGSAAREALRASISVLAQKGVLAIFPEGGSWAPVLRPARPGTALLAAQSGAPLLPIGLDGLIHIFPSLSRGRRAKVTVRIGRTFGPVHVTGKGRQRRQQLDELGSEIMLRIAELIPPERRGVFSSDPDIRAAAQEAAVYPYREMMEP